MGKVKQRRQRGQRYNPTGVSQNGEARSEGRAVSSTAGLRLAEEKITSVLVEERVCGLNTLAAMALEENGPASVVKTSLVPQVSTLLRDPSAEVRLAAAGALRNISAGGSDEVVEAMVHQEVLGPLADLLAEYRESWSPATTDLGQETPRDSDPVSNTFVHATHLLWNLCECSEDAMNVFNQKGLVHVLLRHLDPSTWGHTMALAAAECLLCVTENNSSAASVLLPSADDLVCFISRPEEQPMNLHFATTVAGTLLNINYCTSGSNNFQLVLGVLSSMLQIEPVSLVTLYANDPSSTTNNTLSMTPQEIEHVILGQQLALEMLSNICCPDDDEWDECEDGASDEEGSSCVEESMEEDGVKSSLDPEVYEGVCHFKLFEKTLKKAEFPEENIIQALLGVLRTRALLCLQNMCSALELGELGGAELLYSTWVRLGTMIFQNNCTDSGLLESAAGAMRAIVDRLSQDHSDTLASISQEDLQPVFQAGVSCPVASVRANLTRMVGMLGCLLVTQASEEVLSYGNVFEVLNTSTEFLFKVGAHDAELWVSAEALDVLIDLYSDDKTDKLAHHVHLTDRLRGIQPQFKTKHQQQKKRLGDHKALVLTVKDNLGGFIKYKGPRAAKFNKT
ncbi:HEAT repeat-containing protein 3 [Chionoecetes opilio]|uniref:HEAT repeat-containing protein 3 n=1 Tax=Chionoecetes opilio TaxID=41210 RepID=A0A8J4YSK5_CHIOP|nr:HEAT repeat-containing protein 3 [Chionoecetes opilio]